MVEDAGAAHSPSHQSSSRNRPSHKEMQQPVTAAAPGW
jgi:hypothetical protein